MHAHGREEHCYVKLKTSRQELVTRNADFLSGSGSGAGVGVRAGVGAGVRAGVGKLYPFEFWSGARSVDDRCEFEVLIIWYSSKSRIVLAL